MKKYFLLLSFLAVIFINPLSAEIIVPPRLVTNIGTFKLIQEIVPDGAATRETTPEEPDEEATLEYETLPCAKTAIYKSDDYFYDHVLIIHIAISNQAKQTTETEDTEMTHPSEFTHTACIVAELYETFYPCCCCCLPTNRYARESLTPVTYKTTVHINPKRKYVIPKETLEQNLPRTILKNRSSRNIRRTLEETFPKSFTVDKKVFRLCIGDTRQKDAPLIQSVYYNYFAPRNCTQIVIASMISIDSSHSFLCVTLYPITTSVSSSHFRCGPPCICSTSYGTAWHPRTKNLLIDPKINPESLEQLLIEQVGQIVNRLHAFFAAADRPIQRFL